MAKDYINVQTDLGETVEVDIEEDGYIHLDTVTTHLGQGGLRYINEETGNYRLVKIKDGKFLPPSGGWKAVDTYNVAPLKEKRQSMQAGSGETVPYMIFEKISFL